MASAHGSPAPRWRSYGGHVVKTWRPTGLMKPAGPSPGCPSSDESREQRMVELVPVAQHTVELWEGRAGRVRAGREPYVVADEPHREGPTAVPGAGGRVERQHVERDGVPRLERPAEDGVGFAIGLDVRDLGERALVEDQRAAVEEPARHVPGACGVRAGD